MSQQPMYPAIINSPQTELSIDIDAVQDQIEVLDASALPIAPNLAVIGNDETAETILYTDVVGNILTGVTRGFEGVAKAWSAGVKVARNFTAYDYDALRNNIKEHVEDIDNPHNTTPAQIGAETPAGAQAKANAAEQAAKTYTNQQISAIPAPPVISVAGKTGAVTLAKADVGLSAVLNYGIATAAQAQAGTANNVYMTPLRTKEAITAQTGGIPLRLNNGVLEYNDGTGWKAVGAVYSTRYKGQFTTTSNNGNEVTALSVNGTGRLIYLVTQGGNSQATMRVLVDGIEIINTGSTSIGSDRSFHIARPDPASSRVSTTEQIDLSFKTSLRILVQPKQPSYTADIYWLYEM